jgi:PAS domain S-box-containing protein
VLAVIVIYSGEVEAFGPSEVGFLERLSNDVAFGVNAIRQRAVRERQEVELREARARLAYVLEGSSDGFWDWDILGGHVDFSPSTGSMLGYGPGELAPNASAWARLIHPDDAKGVRAALDAHLRGESGQFAIEHRALHKDGRWIWLLDRGKVVERGADGTPTRMAGTYTDVTERRRSQEALANSERQYRDLLDLSPSPTLLDRGGRIGFVNRAALELFGAERPEQLLGRSPFDLLHPDSHALVRDRTEKIEAEGSVGIGEMRVLRLDGTPREVEAAGALYRDAEGSAMQVILHDVTERRLAERALRESEARHRLLADNALDVVWTMSLDGRITYLSPAVEKLRGYTVAEAMRQPIEEIHPPGSAAVSLGYFQRLAADMGAGRPPQRFRGELEYRCRNGSTVWCEVMVLPVVGPDGAVTELLGVSRDLSERKRTEEALRSSEALLRTVTESSPDAILAKDRHGRWTFANDAALRTVGRSSEEVLGRSDEEILGNSAAARQTMAHDRKVMESGVPQGFEEKLPGPTGMRTLLSSKAPLRDAEGRVVGIVAVAKDVTEQRLMEQRLAVASRLAAMGTLVAGVAHEINNPMTGIMAGLGTATGDIRDHLAKLERGERPSREELVEQAEEVLEVLADADDAAARIARIVQDLAVFGAPNQQRTRRRAAEIVSGAMRWLSAHVHGAATVSFEDLGAPDVMASLGQLEQVLVNLVTNAARATCPGEKGTVAVRIGTGSAGTAFLEVEDRGIGIDPANVGRVFDPFFTTRPAGQGRGTGLGLAICHAIVADHGGAITVESELGKGSRFRVELPAAPGEA